MQGHRVRLNNMISRAGGKFFQVVRSGLFLPRCRICATVLVKAEETIICQGCRDKIVPSRENCCPSCGKFVPDGLAACGSCLLEPPPFERHVSYAAYEGTLRETIILYKYGEIEPLKHLLASLYLDAVARELPGTYDAVVPVPADRHRRRGFQPVRAVGRVLARGLGIPFRPGLLAKKKSTPPQVGLTRSQRQANLDGAFAVPPGARVRGRRILLIDDVTTTGTTIRKCAAVLKRGGAEVTALTLAQSRL
jgi:ComF family protein